jgi:hypothetical protein
MGSVQWVFRILGADGADLFVSHQCGVAIEGGREMTVYPAEAKWGIRDLGRTGPKTIEQWYALVVGLVYLLLGVVGLLATRSQELIGESDVTLFRLVHVDPLHSVVHLYLGVLAVFAALVLTPPATEGVNLALGGALILFAVLGYRGDLHDLLTIPALADPNNVLYLVLGLVTLLFAGPLGVFRRQR